MSYWYFNCVNDINTFVRTYGDGVTFKSVDLNMLIEHQDVLDDCLDFILDLYCSIGLNDDFEPNRIGKRLYDCLECLNDIRYKYHDLNVK